MFRPIRMDHTLFDKWLIKLIINKQLVNTK